MATTLATLRQALGKNLYECHTGTVAAPTTVSVQDAELVDSAEAEKRWEGAWVILTSGAGLGTIRRVLSYDPETGTLTLSRSWTAPAAGTTYEMHTLVSPADMNMVINAALAKCYYVTREEIAAVSGQRQYSLAEYTWLTEPSQVRYVEARYGDTAGQYHYRPLDWWYIEEDTGALTLNVNPVGTDVTLIIEATRPYEALATESETTTCPVDWAIAAAEVELYTLLMRQEPAVDASKWEAHRGLAAMRFLEQCRRHQPRPVLRVLHPLAPHRAGGLWR